jgi:dipeptidyl aminopeptidase/acylaminoacyl peptidase
LLIQGDDDPEVPFLQTVQLAAALRQQQVPVQELIFPDEVHGFLLHRSWLAAYTAEAKFFAHYLKADSSMPPPAAQ